LRSIPSMLRLFRWKPSSPRRPIGRFSILTCLSTFIRGSHPFARAAMTASFTGAARQRRRDFFLSHRVELFPHFLDRRRPGRGPLLLFQGHQTWAFRRVAGTLFQGAALFNRLFSCSDGAPPGDQVLAGFPRGEVFVFSFLNPPSFKFFFSIFIFPPLELLAYWPPHTDWEEFPFPGSRLRLDPSFLLRIPPPTP